MHRKAPVFNNSRPFNPVFSRQIPYSFCFLVLVVFNSCHIRALSRQIANPKQEFAVFGLLK